MKNKLQKAASREGVLLFVKPNLKKVALSKSRIIRSTIINSHLDDLSKTEGVLYERLNLTSLR